MSRIYELDIEKFNRIYAFPTYDKFIFKNKDKDDVVAVDNSNGEFYVEEFSNKVKGLIYLVNDEFLVPETEEEYKKNKSQYEKKYSKVVSSQEDYMLEHDLYDRDFLEFVPDKKYEFDINIGYGRKSFKATIKDALGLASNYESDLVYKDRLIFSPLGFDWEYNHNLIEKYVGKNNLDYKDNGNFELPYIYKDSSCIEWIEKTKDIKL